MGTFLGGDLGVTMEEGGESSWGEVGAQWEDAVTLKVIGTLETPLPLRGGKSKCRPGHHYAKLFLIF